MPLGGLLLLSFGSGVHSAGVGAEWLYLLSRRRAVMMCLVRPDCVRVMVLPFVLMSTPR